MLNSFRVAIKMITGYFEILTFSYVISSEKQRVDIIRSRVYDPVHSRPIYHAFYAPPWARRKRASRRRGLPSSCQGGPGAAPRLGPRSLCIGAHVRGSPIDCWRTYRVTLVSWCRCVRCGCGNFTAIRNRSIVDRHVASMRMRACGVRKTCGGSLLWLLSSASFCIAVSFLPDFDIDFL